MAFWAKFMFWASAVAVVMTGVGLCLIKQTLVSTKIAANSVADTLVEAKKATTQAQNTGRLEIEKFNRESVAYLNVSNIRVDQRENTIRVDVTNFGRSLIPKITVYSTVVAEENDDGPFYSAIPSARIVGLTPNETRRDIEIKVQPAPTAPQPFTVTEILGLSGVFHIFSIFTYKRSVAENDRNGQVQFRDAPAAIEVYHWGKIPKENGFDVQLRSWEDMTQDQIDRHNNERRNESRIW